MLPRLAAQQAAAGFCSAAAGSAAPAILLAARALGVIGSRGLFTSQGLCSASPQPKPQEQQEQQQAPESASANASTSTTSTSGNNESAQAQANAQEMAEKAFKWGKSTYENVRSKVEEAGSSAGSDSSSSGSGDSSSSSSTAGSAQKPSLIQNIAKEVKEVLKPSDDITSATRMYTGPVMEAQASGGPAELMVVQQQQTAWDKVREKVASVPFLSKLTGIRMEDLSAYKKGQELVEDLKDKYENSDHPMVHKVEDVKERLFSGSDSSRAMQEIRMRDPSFDMNRFVRMVKLDAPTVTQAFLKHDMETLKLHCGPELLERFSGIFKHFADQGMYEDPTILFVGDVEIVEVRAMDDDPFIIAQFHCQQLKCTRDKFGNVVDGASDSIQRVYYFWGMQQEKHGVVTADGKLLSPRWVIKDMMWQSMLALV